MPPLDAAGLPRSDVRHGFLRTPMISRRHFLATTGLAFIGLQRVALSASAPGRNAELLGPLVPDPARILDLPEGFRYVLLSKRGEMMADGFRVPGVPDGMAAFPGPEETIVLVRNHELALSMSGIGPFDNNLRLPDKLDPALCYDPGENGREPHFGGTSNIVFDPQEGRVVRQFLSLTGTDRNCAGGAMPWGSWITCEEPEDLVTPRGQRHGWCFEVRATAEPGLQKPVPLKALGRFRHEAVALDPATGFLYLTEDRNDGLLYRFIPGEKNDFTRGRLQALAISGKPKSDLRHYDPAANWPVEGEAMQATWIDLDEVEAPKDDLRFRGFEGGAARFARGEGIHFTKEGIFICCTDGGPARRGQIFRLKPSGKADQPDELTLFIQSGEDDLLTNGDNLCAGPWGGLVVCEDLVDARFASRTCLRGITPDGRMFTIARNGLDNTEFAGSCFSPDGRWLFANMQVRGLTVGITGPWEKITGA
ncbi:alkaline phosphatase PhoX [Haloferula sargassicola]